MTQIRQGRMPSPIESPHSLCIVLAIKGPVNLPGLSGPVRPLHCPLLSFSITDFACKRLCTQSPPCQECLSLFRRLLRLASVTAAGNLPCSTPPAEAPPSKFSASSSLNPFLILFLARCGGAHLPSWHLGVQGQSLGSL